MNTHESYVSLETAKMLKEAGFEWEVNTYYNAGILEFTPLCKNYNNIDRFYISAPTLEVTQRWLREVKGIHVYVISYRQNNQNKISGYCYKVYEFTQGWEFNCSSYEEAQESGIKKALEIILEN